MIRSLRPLRLVCAVLGHAWPGSMFDALVRGSFVCVRCETHVELGALPGTAAAPEDPPAASLCPLCLHDPCRCW